MQNIYVVIFVYVQADEMDFENVIFQGANLLYASLIKTSCRRACLVNMRLIETNGSEANFNFFGLRCVDLNGVTGWESAAFQKENISG